MPSIVERLQIIITAASGGAVRGMKETSAAARAMEGAVGASGRELSALEKRAASAEKTLRAGLGITGLQQKLTQLGPTGARISAGLDSVVGGITAIGPAGLAAGAAGAAGIGILVKATASGIQHFEEIAQQARAFRSATGASAEEASRFAGAMRILGVDVNNGVAGLSILAKTIQHTPEKLTDVGVAIATNRKGFADLEGTLFNVANRYKQLFDSGQVVAAKNLAKDALGRGFKEFLPLLARGEEGVRAFYAQVDQHHEVLSQDDLDKARDLAIAERELTASFQGLEVELGKAVVPALITVIETVTHGIEKADQLGTHLGNIWKHIPKGRRDDITAGLRRGALNSIPGVGPAINYLNDLIGGHDKAAGGAHRHAAAEVDAAAAIKQMETSAREAKAALGDATSAVEGAIAADKAVTSAQQGVASADHAAATAARGVADARRGVRDAQERLNDVLKAGEEVTHRVVEAQRALQKSDEDIADAQERLAEATKKVNDLRAGPSAKDRQKAELAVREAKLGVDEANQRAVEATQRATEAQTPGKAGGRFTGANDAANHANDVADAQLAQQQAANDVEEANIRLADAQSDLNDLNDAGKEGSDQLTEALRDQRDAARRLDDAIHDQAENQRALNQANEGVAQHEREIRDAREGLATATQAVAEASYNAGVAAAGAAGARSALTDAVVKAAKAHEAENKLIAESTEGLLLYRAELEALAAQSPALAAALAPILEHVNELLAASGKEQQQGALSGGTSHAKGLPRNAYGDIYNRPTLGIFGEAGPEMIVPLGRDKRAFALALIARSGLLRNHAFANGGIVGAERDITFAKAFGDLRARRSIASAQRDLTFAKAYGDLSRARHEANAQRDIHAAQINLQVYASGRAEGDAAGRAIVDELVRWQRRNGPIPVRVSG